MLAHCEPRGQAAGVNGRPTIRLEHFALDGISIGQRSDNEYLGRGQWGSRQAVELTTD